MNRKLKNVKKQETANINIGMIIAIIIIALIVAVIGFFFLNNKSNNDNNSINNSGIFKKEKVISAKDIETYNLECDTIWINEALGITYNIPKQITKSALNGSASFSYLHGSSFAYYNSYAIYVDKSLEGHTSLETLASDIISEKRSEKYSEVYKFGSSFLSEFNNTITEKVKIGEYDTVFFESEEIDTKSAFGKGLKVKLLGYSFKYKEQYISVYGELLVEEESQKDNLIHMLQYIINSIKPYNGKTIQELNGNVKKYYDDGYTNAFEDKSTTNVTMNYLSSHARNGVLRCRKTVVEINKEYFTSWDGTSKDILNQLLKYKYANSYIKWYNTAYNSDKTTQTLYDILNEKVININGIDFNEYTLKVYYNSEKSAGKIMVVCFFVVDGNPYLLQYAMNDTGAIGDFTNDEQQLIVAKQSELIVKTYLNTFRLLKSGEEYNSFIDIF